MSAARTAPQHGARRDPTMPPHSIRPWPLPVAESPRVEAVRAELAVIAGPEERERRAAELATALRAQGTPLVEPAAGDDGEVLVTFLWHGEAPHGVLLFANKISDILDPADTALAPIAETRLHSLTLELPSAWLGTYQFVLPDSPLPAPRLHAPVDMALAAGLRARLVEDPHAREYAPNKLGPVRLAVGRGPGAPELRLAERAELDGPVRIPSPSNGEPLALHRWSHPRATPESPAVLLLDGEVWHEQYPIVAELERRIDAGGCEPVHVLLLESGGPRQRTVDYTADAEAMRALLEAVRAAGAPRSAGLILAGQSLGGLFTALAATRDPDLVLAGVAQSPSFWWPNSGRFGEGRGTWFGERAAAARPSPLVLQGGVLEWDLFRDIRQAAELLRVQGGLLSFDTAVGGHDAHWWQALLPDGLVRAIDAAAGR